MNALERDNLQQIEALNQRGGRTLSVVDLINANTIDIDMAAYLLCCVANGASFLTAAQPGGAGKSTVLAALLNFLPPGTRIVTTSRPGVIDEELRRKPNEPACVLAHEIGSGRWFGYIWGESVAKYFRLIDGQRRIGSCQHADTMEELASILTSARLRVAQEDLMRLDLALFMHVDGGFGRVRRRVCAVHECSGRDHPMIFTWCKDDVFEKLTRSVLLPRLAVRQGKDMARIQAELAQARDFVAKLVADDVRMIEDVREEVIGYYGRA